jgi:hypothetical protein
MKTKVYANESNAVVEIYNASHDIACMICNAVKCSDIGWDSTGYMSTNVGTEMPVLVLTGYTNKTDFTHRRWVPGEGNVWAAEFAKTKINEMVTRRIRQVRDALNKCRDLDEIEKVADVLGV